MSIASKIDIAALGDALVVAVTTGATVAAAQDAVRGDAVAFIGGVALTMLLMAFVSAPPFSEW